MLKQKKMSEGRKGNRSEGMLGFLPKINVEVMSFSATRVIC